MKKREGQSFLMGSIVFSLLATLVFLTTGPTLLGPGINTQQFFSQTLGESSHAFNDALAEEKSATHIRRRMESYDRFIERQSLARGIDYSSYSLILLPGEGEAVFYSFYPGLLDINLLVNGDWTNRTIAPGQGFTESFSPGRAKIYLEAPDRNDTASLEASNPGIVKHAVMESEGERWENTIIG